MKSVRLVTKALNGVGILCLFGMMMLTTYDVLMRYVFNKPLKAAFEIDAFLLAAVIWLGLAYTTQMKGHVRVELFVSRLSERKQFYLELFYLLLGLSFFSLIIWRGIDAMLLKFELGTTTENLEIPLAPWMVLVPLGAFMCSIELVLQLVALVSQWRRSG